MVPERSDRVAFLYPVECRPADRRLFCQNGYGHPPSPPGIAKVPAELAQGADGPAPGGWWSRPFAFFGQTVIGKLPLSFLPSANDAEVRAID